MVFALPAQQKIFTSNNILDIAATFGRNTAGTSVNEILCWWMWRKSEMGEWGRSEMRQWWSVCPDNPYGGCAMDRDAESASERWGTEADYTNILVNII